MLAHFIWASKLHGTKTKVFFSISLCICLLPLASSFGCQWRWKHTHHKILIKSIQMFFHKLEFLVTRQEMHFIHVWRKNQTRNLQKSRQLGFYTLLNARKPGRNM
ncbi:hypothetical protein RDI58_029833 [Solanum bulbocastanum]|uniref:Uncharacterized protein n=1 Tax=Solanum bulbocastanum TaxID=147425 RepID=A0AAN8Y0B5_SOLBU